MVAPVVSLETEVVRVPLHTPFVTALRRTEHAETLVLRLTDADGVTGWGEAPQVWRVTGDSLAGSQACLEGPLRDVLLGATGLTAAVGAVQRAVVGNAAARSAADVALHDLAARQAGLTLAAHLAAYAGAEPDRGEVLTDMTLSAGTADVLAEAARARVADGFGTLKLKVGADPAGDAARVRSVREAVGPGVVLRLDANQGWDAHQAVRILDEIRDLGVELVEQPVPRRDLLGLAHVRTHAREVGVPLLADESVFDLDDLVEVVRHRAADLVNVKLAKCGGLTPALELIRVARHHDLGVVIGCMMESHLGVGAAAALAQATGLAGAGHVHDLDAGWWVTGSPYVGGVSYDRDRIVLPDAPGLGITGPAG
ncbi:L-alanine-DL-glutamate epimerase [Nocardioides terrae]|uniref:Dipeptide epimerase n=1 Tax=Nocardioides terrae TaxID=574651 RepID=A0A1I1LGY8_9ACTN|nr:dipeptide epimerase [Nocardioides terrae]SFC72374.1 L-alanine-DL-glutamate epimerase [Nocardioides terrae]